MPTVWQQLGAFVRDVQNVGDHHLDGFAQAGGKHLVVVLTGDQHSAPENRKRLPGFQARAKARGLNVGGWFNGRGGDTNFEASLVEADCKQFGFKLAMLDLEREYHDVNAAKMPPLLAAVRARLPNVELGLSTYGFADRAMIFNGRTLTPPRSLYDLGIRFCPQSLYLYNGKYDPAWAMQDLKTNASTDGNIFDKTAPYGRGIPLSYFHPMLSVEEGHDLKFGLERVRVAQAIAPFHGIWTYCLENLSAQHFALLAAEKGRTFLV